MTDWDPTRRGSEWATCNGCGARWTAHSEAHCTRCHAHFGGGTLFDRHTKQGRCLSERALRRRNMVLVHREPRCPVWRLPTPDSTPTPGKEATHGD